MDNLTELKVSGQLWLGGLTRFDQKVHINISPEYRFSVTHGSAFNNESVLVDDKGVHKTPIHD